MSVRERLERCRAAHWPAMQELLDAAVRETTPAGSILGGMCEYHLETGGKRLRAVIPLLAAEALGGDPTAVRPFGAACEMLHNATLVHDDLQDGDAVRRGRPTVWKRWSPAQAINLGDAMFYWAVALIGRVEASAEIRLELCDLLVRGTLQVIDGQAREFQLKDDPRPTLPGYFAVVEGKTAGLFHIPLAGAAALVAAPPEVRAALGTAARDLGVLFQIQDDVLDLYGEKGRERRGSDIAEGKISALVVHCLEHAAADDAARLREILARPRDRTGEADVEQADRLFRETGSVRFALEEIERRERAVAEDPVLRRHPALHELLAGLAEAFLEPIRPVLARFRPPPPHPG